MAAVRTDPLYLWPRGRPAGSNETLGSISINGIDGPWGSADGGLRVDLGATIVSAWPTRRPNGRVRPLPD